MWQDLYQESLGEDQESDAFIWAENSAGLLSSSVARGPMQEDSSTRLPEIW